ncbi:gp53-like domain-containing protein [Enterobacter asburiae]|uniref:gp53-like domain-containing protein n=1 Tax=Enterobacter asburiae TaxID=61645 RepID=UPI003CEB6539
MLRIGQVEATATQDGKYTDGSVAGGIAATRLRAAAFNAMQEELAHIVESARLALDINDMTQVLKAIQKLTLSRANPFADIKSDGAAAISTALTNLGLGTAATKNVGTGSGQIPDMSSFTASRASTGWQKLPGGLIIQWGQAATNTSSLATVAYPIPFPNNVFQVIGSCLDVNNADIVAINSTDGINFNLVAWVATSGSVLRTTTPVKWIAIGN